MKKVREAWQSVFRDKQTACPHHWPQIGKLETKQGLAENLGPVGGINNKNTMLKLPTSQCQSGIEHRQQAHQHPEIAQCHACINRNNSS